MEKTTMFNWIKQISVRGFDLVSQLTSIIRSTIRSTIRSVVVTANVTVAVICRNPVWSTCALVAQTVVAVALYLAAATAVGAVFGVSSLLIAALLQLAANSIIELVVMLTLAIVVGLGARQFGNALVAFSATQFRRAARGLVKMVELVMPVRSIEPIATIDVEVASIVEAWQKKSLTKRQIKLRKELGDAVRSGTAYPQGPGVQPTS